MSEVVEQVGMPIMSIAAMTDRINAIQARLIDRLLPTRRFHE